MNRFTITINVPVIVPADSGVAGRLAISCLYSLLPFQEYESRYGVSIQLPPDLQGISSPLVKQVSQSSYYPFEQL